MQAWGIVRVREGLVLFPLHLIWTFYLSDAVISASAFYFFHYSPVDSGLLTNGYHRLLNHVRLAVLLIIRQMLGVVRTWTAHVATWGCFASALTWSRRGRPQISHLVACRMAVMNLLCVTFGYSPQLNFIYRSIAVLHSGSSDYICHSSILLKVDSCLDWISSIYACQMAASLVENIMDEPPAWHFRTGKRGLHRMIQTVLLWWFTHLKPHSDKYKTLLCLFGSFWLTSTTH